MANSSYTAATRTSIWFHVSLADTVLAVQAASVPALGVGLAGDSTLPEVGGGE